MSEQQPVQAIDILMELEKVFALEVEYDECLMNLGLHTAQVRKTCPNLFTALSSVGKDDLKAKATQDQESLLTSLLDIVKRVEQESAVTAKTVSDLSSKAVSSVPAQNGLAEHKDKIMFTPVPQQSASVPGFTPAPVVEEEKPLPTYTEFAQRFAMTSRMGDEWVVAWDNPAPLPTLNGPLTLRTEAGRIRFNVIAVDEDLRRLRLRHITSPQGGG